MDYQRLQTKSSQRSQLDLYEGIEDGSSSELFLGLADTAA